MFRFKEEYPGGSVSDSRFSVGRRGNQRGNILAVKFIKEQTDAYYLFDTALSNIFIDEHMAKAPGEYVKVYLFALMYADLNMVIDNRDIANYLTLDLEDVLKAWTYWESAGVVRKVLSGTNELEYDVEFVDLKRPYTNAPATQKKSSNFDRLIDSDVKELFKNIERYMGQLRGDDPQKIIGWIDAYGATSEIIDYAFRYAKERKDKVNVNYVGAIVIDWCERGFKSTKDVKEYLGDNDKRHNEYKQIMRAAGKAYNITPEEMKAIDRWMDEWGYGLSEILDRFKRAKGIKNPFVYVEKIISEERKKGDDPKMSSSFVGEVNDYYKHIRERNAEAARKRQAEVYDKIPEIKDIELEIRRIGFEIPKVILAQASNSKEKAEQLNNEILRLQSERKGLLENRGYDSDYMEVAYMCAECKDTGILDNGERCSCFTKRMEELRI